MQVGLSYKTQQMTLNMVREFYQPDVGYRFDRPDLHYGKPYNRNAFPF